MPNRVRQLLESILFAGLKPGGAKAPTKTSRWLGPLAGPIDRLLSGSKPPDPLYLSARTPAQRFRVAALIALPILLIGSMVAVVLINKTPAPSQPQAELTAAEIASKTLPDLPKDIRIDSNTDVQIVEALVKPGPSPKLTGTVRNNTERRIRVARLVFDLTDSQGSQVGGASTTVRDLAPKATNSFELVLKQKDAAFVIVREARPE